ncbi:MAG: tRNA 2-thiouridine(34) synthase MnmA [Polyangiaceae bacterium]|nr:tRNA 2-thiouridine(34) synthase MnmA [Polyangiaceae bacterium]
MSGGVDSSVAALRLARAGYDVVGVTLHLWDYPEDPGEKGRCCAPEDQYDARRVADHLDFPHFTFDRRELFQEHVVGPFVDAYLTGKTPSPCVSCNRTVKLRELFPIAKRLGARYVATGHYARVERTEGGASLHRGRDADKDQSYFLHMLRPDELDRLLLPLGDATKAEVRAEAEAAKLPGAGKGESQELCFVASSRYDVFVEARADGRVRPGPLLDPDGRIIGQHGGVHRFTVGQRKGLGVSLGRPAFVVGVDAESAAVQLGFEEDTFATGALLADDIVFSEGVSFPLEATVKVRARHTGERATLRRVTAADGSEKIAVHFDKPVRAVSPGQIAVAYDGTRVVGGGRIERALREEQAS